MEVHNPPVQYERSLKPAPSPLVHSGRSSGLVAFPLAVAFT